jgi:hypothetical protein
MPVGGVVVVAEGLGDDGGGGLEGELAQGGGERGAGGDAELGEQRGHGRGVERLAGAAAGEQPAAGGVGGGVHVLPAGGQLEQQAGEWPGDGGWRVAEPQQDRAVAAVDDVVDGEPDDAAGGLGEQQRQAGGGPGADRGLAVGECPAQQAEAALLGDGRAAGRCLDWRQGEPGQVPGF